MIFSASSGSLAGDGHASSQKLDLGILRVQFRGFFQGGFRRHLVVAAKQNLRRFQVGMGGIFALARLFAFRSPGGCEN